MNIYKNNHLAFPFHIDNNGKSAQITSLDEHVRDELIQLLLTNPGERDYLPEFGGGVRRLIFQNTDQTIVGITKATITNNISRWLSGRIILEDLKINMENEKIEIDVKYRINGTEDSKQLRFQHKGG